MPTVALPRAGSPKQAIAAALGVTALTAIVLTYAFDPERGGEPSLLLAIGALYATLAAAAIRRLKNNHELGARLRPRAGDLTFGVFVGALLYGGAMAGRLFFAPHGSEREAWIIRVYLQVGDPGLVDMHLVGAAVLVIAALEEITWRGLVLPILEEPFGARRAWLWSTLLFGLAHVPVAYQLRDETAGLNPLIPMAALGCSFVWGYLAIRTDRLAPSIFAHALFSWAIIEFPLWTP